MNARRWKLLPLVVPFALLSCGDDPTTPTGTGGTRDPSGPTACVATSPDPAVIRVGESLELNASCSAGGSALVSYRWELGDGRMETGMVIHPSYDEVGTFHVRLRVTDAQQREDTVELDVLVGTNPVAVEACFESTQVPMTETDLAPCGFRFDASCSTGDVTEYRWFFEGNPEWPDFDDVTMTTTEPEVTYTWREDIECFAFRPFERTVRLTVVGEGRATSTVEERLAIDMP